MTRLRLSRFGLPLDPDIRPDASVHTKPEHVKLCPYCNPVVFVVCARGHKFVPCEGDTCAYLGHTSAHPGKGCHQPDDIGYAGVELCGWDPGQNIFWKQNQFKKEKAG